eukprot:3703425-Alexandrium_andersonii.AAC.1
MRSQVAPRSKLLSPEFDRVTFQAVPIFQTKGQTPYVEYLLRGRGGDFPSERSAFGWIAGCATIDNDAPIKKCDLPLGPDSLREVASSAEGLVPTPP